jgi:uncharacterized protein YbjT (DUF2867 family)
MTLSVFITGGTGYVGRAFIVRLLERGHGVRALVRPGSERKLPPGASAIFGDALRAETYQAQIRPGETFVQLVGVAHPSPAKAAEFRAIDRASALGAIAAAKNRGAGHFVYLSVAQPAPLMRDYIAVRAECEEALRSTGLPATVLRPWYVLGPGHRWPYALIPFYWLAERIPATREGAQRLGLVTLGQMVAALVAAVENPPTGIRILEVPQIRAARA